MDLKVLRTYAAAFVDDYRQFARRQFAPTCPICGFEGMFVSVGRPPRWNARCPRCDSRERHRLAYLYYLESGLLADTSLRILHFAPEPFMPRLMSAHAGYLTTDPALADMARREDIRQLSFADGSFDVVLCHHVLEHVDDDAAAFRELLRVLRPGGRAVLSTPINWSREDSYEDGTLASDVERAAAFGAVDHIRYYGRDFRARLEAAGFQVEVFRKDKATELRSGLLRDEVLFVATR